MGKKYRSIYALLLMEFKIGLNLNAETPASLLFVDYSKCLLQQHIKHYGCWFIRDKSVMYLQLYITVGAAS
jgi:hypothetical protein